MSLGPAEILVVLTVALILVDPTWLPEVSRQVDGARRELRKIHDTVRSEIRWLAVIDGHVGPVPRMTSHEPLPAEPLPAFTAASRYSPAEPSARTGTYPWPPSTETRSSPRPGG